MPVYSRILLSGSTSGKPIPIAATATPGTLIHTGVAGSDSYDEVWLWVTNITNAVRTVTLEWGGVSDPGDLLLKNYSIAPYSGLYGIAVGHPINGGLIIRAFADAANALNASGFVNRIS
jgi:hypothetical protein